VITAELSPFLAYIGQVFNICLNFAIFVSGEHNSPIYLQISWPAAYIPLWGTKWIQFWYRSWKITNFWRIIWSFYN